MQRMNQSTWIAIIGSSALIGLCILFIINGCNRTGRNTKHDSDDSGQFSMNSSEQVTSVSGGQSQVQTLAKNGIRNDGGLNVAVIDLDVIAKQVGVQAEMDSKFAQKQAEIQQKWDERRRVFDHTIGQMQMALGPNPTEQQVASFQQMQQEQAQQLDRDIAALRAELQDYDEGLKQSFLNRIRPVALDVARFHNLSIVVTRSQTFVYDPAADITKQVIDAWKKDVALRSEVNRAQDRAVETVSKSGGGKFNLDSKR